MQMAVLIFPRLQHSVKQAMGKIPKQFIEMPLSDAVIELARRPVLRHGHFSLYSGILRIVVI